MKIPTTVRIGAHKYTIKEVAQSELEEPSCGMTDKQKGIIFINKNLMQTEKEATFLHEVLHIINDQIKHETIESLAQQLYAFLKGNKIIK